MIRSAELITLYPYSQEAVWTAITGGESNLAVTPITEEQAETMQPDLNRTICQVTALEPQTRCAMRMRGMSFVTDWSATLSAAGNGGTRVIYRQSTDFATKRLYLVAPLIMNPKTQLQNFSKDIHRKLSAKK